MAPRKAPHWLQNRLPAGLLWRHDGQVSSRPRTTLVAEASSGRVLLLAPGALHIRYRATERRGAFAQRDNILRSNVLSSLLTFQAVQLPRRQTSPYALPSVETTASAEQPTVKAPAAVAVALQPAERGCWTEPSQ